MRISFPDISSLTPTEARGFRPTPLDRKLDALAFRAATLLRGPAGVGKTEAIQAAAVRGGHLLIRVSCTEQTDDRHLLGSILIEGGETVFKSGALLTAIHSANELHASGEPGGVILFLDEINTLTPETQKILNPMMDGGRQVTVRGTVHRLDKGAKLWVVGAANPNFAGTYTLNTDLLSRFPAIFDVGYMPSDIERMILVDAMEYGGRKTKVPSNERMASALVQLATEIRGGQRAEGVGRYSWVISTRDLVAVGELMGVLGDGPALSLLVGKFSPTDHADLGARVKSILGIDITKEGI